MPLHVYNTLTRKKEPFKPLTEGFVGVYVCGPTVYGHSHLGHAKSYVSFDVMVRYLRFLKYNVLYVQNITDVGHLLGDANEGEDRVLKQSRVERKHPMQVAEEYTRSYFEDMDALNVLRPDVSPRATGHITEQIELIKTLIGKGLAYEVNGSVYFDVHRHPGYGKLSGRNIDELEAGSRVEIKSEKRHPADFALWKRAEPEHLMQWPSPWGRGFPGWHVECSAMSMKYLGITFDIHGGGLENQFPHHECEIAQSEGATGKPFVRYWLHNNMVTVQGQKMGKSLNNFVTLKDAFARWSPAVVRFFILQSHYRSTLDFSDEALEAAATGLSRLTNMVHTLTGHLARKREGGGGGKVDTGRYRKAFLDAMDDDFNTPQAIAVLFDLVREVNAILGEPGSIDESLGKSVLSMLEELAGGVLGLKLEVESDNSGVEASLMALLIDLREEIRKKKMWDLSDSIRDSLHKIGIVIEDRKEGTTWKRLNNTTAKSPDGRS
jgi:cysteinyl-tRNA synthetase